jgi:hypothetical protein
MPDRMAAKGYRATKTTTNSRHKDEPGMLCYILRRKPPVPPARRPNILERISMLQMAELHHTGIVPFGGVKLSIVIPTVYRVDDSDWMQLRDCNDDEGISIIQTTSIVKKAIRAFCNLFMNPWKRRTVDLHNSDIPMDAVRVRLLNEDEW